jgi:hypothetical protein
MAASPSPESDLVRAAARLRRLLTLFVLFLFLVLIAERAGYAGAYRAADRGPAGLLGGIAVQAILAAPAILYLAGLWQLRRAAAAVAAGGPFHRSVVRAIRRVGAWLVAGAAVSLAAMPLLHRLLGQPYPRLIDFDIATLILGGIGFGLVFLARLVDRAGAVQAELDEIF